MKLSSFACTLAAQIRKADPSVSLASSMQIAWLIAKAKVPSNILLTFKKVGGEICKRVVSTSPDLFPTFKGTGKPLKEGQKMFIDLGKYIGGKPAIISTYESNIIERLAA